MSGAPSSAAPSVLLSAIREQSSALNLRPLQRIDPLTRSVLFTGKHSVLYRLERRSEQWERDNVEGPFFITQRAATPTFALVILNRLGLDSWTMPLHADTRLELQEEHYVFIQSGADVVGVWFYESSDAQQAAEQLTALTQRLHAHTHGHSGGEDDKSDDSTHYKHEERTHSQHGATNSSSDQPSASNSVQQPQPSGRADRGSPFQQPPAAQLPAHAAGKRLHSQPPPPPALPLSDAVESASESQLRGRLADFLRRFSAEDEAHSQAHRAARSQQLNSNGATTLAALAAVAPVHSAHGTPLPLDALFQYAAAASSVATPPQPLAPHFHAALHCQPPLTAAELERSLAEQREASHDPPPSAALHPLVSQLFQHSAHSAQQQPQWQQPAPPQPSAAPPAHVASRQSLSLRLTFPSLPPFLSPAALVAQLQAALSDERTVADLYLQYAQQQQQH